MCISNILVQSFIFAFLKIYLYSLALESSVENANKSNKGDEEEPPPEDQENLEWMVSCSKT